MDSDLVEARLKRMSPEAQSLVAEIEEEFRNAPAGSDPEETLDEFMPRIQGLGEADQQEMMSVLEHRATAHEQQAEEDQAQADTLSRVQSIVRRAQDHSGREDMSIGEAFDYLKREDLLTEEEERFIASVGNPIIEVPEYTMLSSLKHERYVAGLTQEELAEKSGVHRDTIQKLETRQRPARPATIKKLADALGVQTEKLTQKERGRPRMNKEQTITVPALYPDFDDPDTFRKFDGSSEAWLWDELQDFRDRAIVESLARIVVERGEDADLPGMAQVLWHYFFRDDAEEFVEDHREDIERRVRELEED